jgi:hypothetical protein
MLVEYSDRLFYSQYSANSQEMLLARAMFGCFWKNPIICYGYPIFDDLFGGLDKTGRLLLACLSGGVLEKCKERSSRQGEDIKVQKAGVDRSFRGLVFSTGLYYVFGESVCFDTVSNWDFAVFKDHDVKGEHGHRFYDSDEEKQNERLPHEHDSSQNLPDISASEPDSWWLGRNLGNRDDWKEWYLVNYKEKRIFVGPTGQSTGWPEYYQWSWKEIHFWSPSFVEFGYYINDE